MVAEMEDKGIRFLDEKGLAELAETVRGRAQAPVYILFRGMSWYINANIIQPLFATILTPNALTSCNDGI